MAIYKIFSNNEEINRIVADEDFVIGYCAANGYSYELEPDPEPVEPGETEPSVEERVSTLEETTQQQGEILSILLSGATEAEE